MHRKVMQRNNSGGGKVGETAWMHEVEGVNDTQVEHIRMSKQSHWWETLQADRGRTGTYQEEKQECMKQKKADF